MTGLMPLKIYKGSGATGKSICTTSHYATRNKAGNTNIIALFGSALQAVVGEKKGHKGVLMTAEILMERDIFL